MKITTPVGIMPTIKTSTATDNTVPTHSATTVKKSAPSEQYLDLNNKISTASDIDMGKVNEVRDMLKNNTLTLDLEALSEAIVAMHRK